MKIEEMMESFDYQLAHTLAGGYLRAQLTPDQLVMVRQVVEQTMANVAQVVVAQLEARNDETGVCQLCDADLTERRH